MDVKEKSFFQTTAGVVTGLAGILTAVVGLLTVGAQLGWFSTKDANTSSTTTNPANATLPSTSFGTPTTSGRTGVSANSSSGGASSSAPQFTVDPPAVTFENLGPRDQVLTVTNTGNGSITFLSPTITGTNASQFTTSNQTCGTSLDPGRTCQLKVSFTPTGVGTYTGTLLIKPSIGPNREVPLKGTSLL